MDAYELWGKKKTYIAQLEMLAVFVAIVDVAAEVRNCHGLWCIDDVATLMALVKRIST